MSLRHFRTLLDLEREDLAAILTRAHALREGRGSSIERRPLAGKSVAIIFEKASTRTRVSFEVGVHELGGLPVTLMSRDTQIGRGEPLEDTARMLSGFVHAIVCRTFGQERIETLAKHARVPVVNALTDEYHPCQLLADLQTVGAAFDRPGADFSGLRVAWIGDGNNMAHSWVNAALLAGFELTLACPEGYRPLPSIVESAVARGAKVRVVSRPEEAASGAHVVTTDVWASMGQEGEAEARRRAFAGYLVDDALMARADAGAIFLHCLPAHRGEEVAASVIDGPKSRVWEEAENRLHAQKALLEWLFEG